MTIAATGRYATGVAINVTNPDGTVEAGVMRGAATVYTRYLHYTVTVGDRIDNLAFRFFGNPNLWWLIADANPSLGYPFPLVPGTILAIPKS